MRLTTTDRYLGLLLHTLETRIIPDLSSPAVKEIAGTMKVCLQELQRREKTSITALQKAISKGQSILNDIALLLEDKDSEYQDNTSIERENTNAFNPLAETLDTLTTKLANSAQKIRGIDNNEAVVSLLRRAADWELETHNALQESIEEADEPVSDEPLPKSVLESFLQANHSAGDKLKITEFERATVGLGKQTFLIEIETRAAGKEPLVVRKMDETPLIAFKAFNLEQEFHLLKAVSATGFLSPTPLWLGKDVAGADNDFYVMNRLPGEVMGTWIAGADKLPEQLVLKLAELMAQLHNLQLEQFSEYIHQFESPSLMTETMSDCYRRTLSEWRDYCASDDHLASPTLVYALDWLIRNVPEDDRKPVLIHGDFNVHNLLADGEEVTGVLDWECAMFGAPEQDLAWIRPNISQHIAFDKFVDHYLACGGKPLRLEWLDYYHAFSSMRQTSIISRGVKNLQEERTHDIRHSLLQVMFAPEVMRQTLDSAMYFDKRP